MHAATPGGYGGAGGVSPAAGPGGVASANVAQNGPRPVNGGRFDFDDGGTYCGGWEDGKAHGHGVCTGPKGQGEYSGSWHFGFEVSGVYTWPSGSTFEGQWQNGKRHGLGTEYRGRWTYRGEWTQGFKGRYGVRQATASNAKYEGTWANGLQDGYGSETYADGGTYQGQWLRGLRHGYGVRTSAPFGMASHFRPKAPAGSMASLKSESAAEPTSERDRRMDDVRGGFVLRTRSDEPPLRRRSLVERSSNFKESLLKGLKLRKQRSTGDLDKRGTSSSIRSTGSTASWMSNDSAQSAVTSGSHHTDSNASFVVEDEQMDASVTETYMGEWKNDKRCGFGISERSDGLKYEGEWYNNKKYGYGVTTFKDGTKEEGKYKNNVLITSQKKKHLFLIRSAKFRERIDAAVNAAQRASKIALQKADIAISRTATARGKGEQADMSAGQARSDSEVARVIAKQFAPDFHQPGSEALRHRNQMPAPDLSRLTSSLSNQRQPSLQQLGAGLQPRGSIMMRGDGSTALGTRRLPSVGPGGEDYNRFEDNPPTTHMASSSSYPSTSFNNNYSSNSGDRASLLNHPLDGHSQQSFHQPQQSAHHQYTQNHPQHHQQQQLQQQPQQQQRYNYDQTDPFSGMRLSQQNLLHDTVIGTMGGNRKNSLMTDSSNPHSHMMDDRLGMDQQQQPGPSRGRDTVRRSQAANRNSSAPNGANNYGTANSDHFEHYKRPPSRDSSVDRFSNVRSQSRTRGTTPEVQGRYSRASSRHRTPFEGAGNNAVPLPGGATGLRGSHSALLGSNHHLSESMSRLRGETPSRQSGKDSPVSGLGGGGGLENSSAMSGSSLFDETILKQRGLGQEIPPVPYTPKRTESLFLKSGPPISKGSPSNLPKIPSGGGGGGGGSGGATIKRKKSLPDANSLPKASVGMSREEVAALGSARRQELHRMQDEQERLRANPLLYLLNPNIMPMRREKRSSRRKGAKSVQQQEQQSSSSSSATTSTAFHHDMKSNVKDKASEF